MSRHTTFRYCLDPTVEQQAVLARHTGASRFAFNQALRMVKTALNDHRVNPEIKVPWTGFELINAFNAWKKTEEAGRTFVVSASGVVEPIATGLSWRNDVCQQVFEEAVVDLSKGLKAWSDSRSGKSAGKRVGFPRFKKKASAPRSFRLRNRHPKGCRPTIRIGDQDRPRSVTLPGLGTLAVRDDTRRLRRMLAKGRAKILFVTITRHAGRWWISLNIEAAELHAALQHPARDPGDGSGFIGIDRGLKAFLVGATADGQEVTRVSNAPKALAVSMHRQRRLARKFARTRKGSRNRQDAAAKLGRHYCHVAEVRRHFLHQVTNTLVKTHDRLVIEDLNISGMLRNHRLAQAISDAAWAEFARLLTYKLRWRGGELVLADRWYPSSRLCPACGTIQGDMTLALREFTCGCGHRADRDANAATNLARWGEAHHKASPDPRTPKQRGRANNARRRDGADRQPSRAGETSPDDAGTDVHAAPAA